MRRATAAARSLIASMPASRRFTEPALEKRFSEAFASGCLGWDLASSLLLVLLQDDAVRAQLYDAADDQRVLRNVAGVVARLRERAPPGCAGAGDAELLATIFPPSVLVCW